MNADSHFADIFSGRKGADGLKWPIRLIPLRLRANLREIKCELKFTFLRREFRGKRGSAATRIRPANQLAGQPGPAFRRGGKPEIPLFPW